MNGRDALKPLYLELKPSFMQYMRRYTQEENLRLDAYHEAMVAFYEYCVEGHYDPSRSAPKTLIFKMGSAYLINRLKKERREIQDEDVADLKIHERLIEQYEFELTESETEIKAALLQLGKKCRELLELYFYHNFSIEVIRYRMHYKNDNVVSSHKSRCIKQIKEILTKNKK